MRQIILSILFVCQLLTPSSVSAAKFKPLKGYRWAHRPIGVAVHREKKLLAYKRFLDMAEKRIFKGYVLLERSVKAPDRFSAYGYAAIAHRSHPKMQIIAIVHCGKGKCSIQMVYKGSRNIEMGPKVSGKPRRRSQRRNVAKALVEKLKAGGTKWLVAEGSSSSSTVGGTPLAPPPPGTSGSSDTVPTPSGEVKESKDVGEACTQHTDCKTQNCDGNKCRRNEGEKCDEDEDCDSRSFCSEKKCKRRLRKGRTCAEDRDCLPNLKCVKKEKKDSDDEEKKGKCGKEGDDQDPKPKKKSSFHLSIGGGGVVQLDNADRHSAGLELQLSINLLDWLVFDVGGLLGSSTVIGGFHFSFNLTASYRWKTPDNKALDFIDLGLMYEHLAQDILDGGIGSSINGIYANFRLVTKGLGGTDWRLFAKINIAPGSYGNAFGSRWMVFFRGIAGVYIELGQKKK